MPDHALPPNVTRLPVSSSYLTRRLLQHYRSADPSHVRAGLRWYDAALRHSRRLARQHGVPIANVVVALAHLSPRTPWARNLTLLEQLLAGEPKPAAAMERSWQTASASLEVEDPMSTFSNRALKTMYFAQAILGDQTAVVVDTWMGRALSLTERQIRTVGGYYAVFDAVHRGARRVDLTPRNLQAVVWCSVRGSHD